MRGIILGLVFLFLFLYIWFFYLSFRGCGYMGYYGYHYGPSWWYWGPTVYYGPSVRGESVSGPARRGGGPRMGK